MIIAIFVGLFVVGYVQTQQTRQVYLRGTWTNTTTQVIAGRDELFVYNFDERVGPSGTWGGVSGRSTKFTITPRAHARIVSVDGQGQGTQDPVTLVWTGVTTVTVPTNQFGTVNVAFIIDTVGQGLLVAEDVASGKTEPAAFMARVP